MLLITRRRDQINALYSDPSLACGRLNNQSVVFFSDIISFVAGYAHEFAALWYDELGFLDWQVGLVHQFWIFLNLFPIMASLLWSLSALYGLVFARKKPIVENLPEYSVVIPFFAESGGALRTARSLSVVNPPPKEIILVDDGSPQPCQLPPDLDPRIRMLRLPHNMGKAAAVQIAADQTKTPILACLDADLVVTSADWKPMLSRFVMNSRLAAVTGAIHPGQCRRLIQFIQALDYLIVINFVKRAEEQWGALMTISGAWVAYRVEAVKDCGGWNSDSCTEDIDLSWRLQGKGWQLEFADDWHARVEMAPSWKSLWLQRSRWSAGLGRAFRDHFLKIWSPESTLLPVGIMAIVTTIWLWGCLVRIMLVLAGWVTGLVFLDLSSEWFNCEVFIPRSWLLMVLYLGVFALQILSAMISDGLRWRRYQVLLLLVPIYPIYFWCILFTGYFFGFVKGFLRWDSGRWRRTIRYTEI